MYSQKLFNYVDFRRLCDRQARTHGHADTRTLGKLVKVLLIVLISVGISLSTYAQCPQDEGQLCMYGYDEVAQTYEPEGVVNADGEMVMAMFVSNISELEFQSVRSIQISVNINPGSTPVTINQTKTENSLHGVLKNKSWIQVQFPTSNSVLITGNDFSGTDLLDLQLVDEIIRIYYTGPAGGCFTHQISGQWRFFGMQTPSPPCSFEIPTGCQNVSGCFPSVSLSGAIKTYPNSCTDTYDFGLDQVSVHIYDQDPFGSNPVTPLLTVLTDAYGEYEATPLEPGGDYWVVPEKHHNPNCGLDMTDYTILYNHVFHANYITDNWSLFVANVNDIGNPNTLTVSDVLGLNNRIMDLDPYPSVWFPRSWFFMRNEDWLEWIYNGNWTPGMGIHVPPAEEFYFVEDVTVDQTNLNFKAGKAGDIDPNCTNCTSMFSEDDELAVIRESDASRLIEGEIQVMDDPSIVSIPYYMPEVRDDQIWLLSLGYPTDEYFVESVRPIGITDNEHFVWNVQENLEVLSVLWSPSTVNPLPLNRQQPAFTVQIRRVDGQKVDNSPFFLKAHPAKDGVVEGPYNIRPWELIREEPATHADASIVRVFPNPASETLWLSSRESLGVGTFEMYDLYGRLVQSQSLAPMHAGELYALDITLIPQGMYFFVYNTTNGRYSGKVSVVK